jgi:hypothetical protein
MNTVINKKIRIVSVWISLNVFQTDVATSQSGLYERSSIPGRDKNFIFFIMFIGGFVFHLRATSNGYLGLFPPRPALVPTQPPIQWVLGALS